MAPLAALNAAIGATRIGRSNTYEAPRLLADGIWRPSIGVARCACCHSTRTAGVADGSFGAAPQSVSQPGKASQTHDAERPPNLTSLPGHRWVWRIGNAALCLSPTVARPAPHLFCLLTVEEGRAPAGTS